MNVSVSRRRQENQGPKVVKAGKYRGMGIDEQSLNGNSIVARSLANGRSVRTFCDKHNDSE